MYHIKLFNVKLKPFNKNIEKINIMQFLRYAITGGLSAICDFTAFVITLYVLEAHYQFSTFAGLFTGFIINYLMSKLWVFEIKRKITLKELSLFLIITAVGFLFTGFFMYLGVEKFNFNKSFTRLTAMVIVFFYNFFARKYIIWYD